VVQVTIADRFLDAINAGFNTGEALVMTAISLKECPVGSCGSDTASGVNSNGSRDYGIWQISSGTNNSRFTDPHHTPWGDITDPVNNAKAAFSLYKGAGGGEAGYRQWCTYPGGCGVNGGPNQYTQSELQQTVNDIARILGGDAPAPGTGIPGTGGQGGGSSSGGNSGGGSGITQNLLSGPIVVAAAFVLILIGAMIWKGGAVAQTVERRYTGRVASALT